MIDEKGKVFGLINLIDLFVILGIILGVGFLSYKSLKKEETIIVTNQPVSVILKFYSGEVVDYVADVINVGDSAEDNDKSIPLGEVTHIERDTGFIYELNELTGELIKADKEDYSSIELTTKLNAQIVPGGININGNTYTIGHSLTVRAGKGKIYMRVSGIEPVSE